MQVLHGKDSGFEDWGMVFSILLPNGKWLLISLPILFPLKQCL